MQDEKIFQNEFRFWLALGAIGSIVWFNLYFQEHRLLATGLGSIAAALSAIILDRCLNLPMRRWKKLQTHLQTEESLDVQRNFISLLSHNLNTPIAKLIGILQILVDRTKSQTLLHGYLESCLSRTLRIQYYSKSTLQTTSLSSHNHRSIHAIPLRIVLESIEETLVKLRSFVEVNFTHQHSSEVGDFLHYPVHFEARQVSQLIAGIAYILQLRSNIKKWRIVFDFETASGENSTEQNKLSLAFCSDYILTASALDWFKPDAEINKDFLLDLNREHAQEMLRLYQGSLQISESNALVVNLHSLTS